MTLAAALAAAANPEWYSRADLGRALGVLARRLEQYRATVTSGGPAHPVDTGWANLDPGAPPTAGDDTAPPLHSPRSSTRLVDRA